MTEREQQPMEQPNVRLETIRATADAMADRIMRTFDERLRSANHIPSSEKLLLAQMVRDLCDALLDLLSSSSAPALRTVGETKTETTASTNSGFYVASRVKHAAMWQSRRLAGAPITSSWIDEAGEGDTASFSELWTRIQREIGAAGCLVFYAEAADFPFKGALVEVGIALASGVPVRVVLAGDVILEPRTLRPLGSWLCHPLVTQIASLDAALVAATVPPPPSAPRVEEEAETATATAPNADPLPPRVERWAVENNKGIVLEVYPKQDQADARVRLSTRYGTEGPYRSLRLVELREGEEVVGSAYLDDLEATAANAAESQHKFGEAEAEAVRLRREAELLAGRRQAADEILQRQGPLEEEVADLRSQLAAARQHADSMTDDDLISRKALRNAVLAMTPSDDPYAARRDFEREAVVESMADVVAAIDAAPTVAPSASQGWVEGVVEQGAIAWPPIVDTSGTIVTEHVVALRYVDWPIGTRVEVRQADTAATDPRDPEAR